MFNTLARSVAVGVFAAGAILGASGIASASPFDPDGHDEYIDEDLPADSSAPVADTDTITYCPPGYNVFPDAKFPGVPIGCVPPIPAHAGWGGGYDWLEGGNDSRL